jgi:hypothetical protein
MALPIRAPGFCQVGILGDRKTRSVGADRQADDRLPVVLFADLSAGLLVDADGVFAFLRKNRIVDDPGGNGMATGHLRENVLADALEKELVVPGRLGDNLMQGLVSVLEIIRVETSGHGFSGFVFSEQEEAEAVAGEGLMPVSLSYRLRQTLREGGKTLLAGTRSGGGCGTTPSVFISPTQSC